MGVFGRLGAGLLSLSRSLSTFILVIDRVVRAAVSSRHFVHPLQDLSPVSEPGMASAMPGMPAMKMPRFF